MLRPLFRSSMLISIRAALGVLVAANRVVSSSPKLQLGLHRSAIVVSRGVEISDPSRVGAKFMCTVAGPSSAVEPMSLEENNEIQLLPAVADDFGGLIVEMKDRMEPREFVSSLRLSIFHWRQQGKKGVWIKLPIELANLVQPAVEATQPKTSTWIWEVCNHGDIARLMEGFWYHHAEPSYLMLVYWIPSTDHTLPVNASHRVGVGAFVLNDKKEVLAVQEKSGKLRGTGIWKFPTGVVDQGENISTGAIREVKEETGIDAEFVEVLAFRQSHKSLFDKSDLFFVCFLRPISFDIQKQESEIEAAQWMPLEEFAAQPFIQTHELMQYIIKVGSTKAEGAYRGFSPLSIRSGFTGEKDYIYLNTSDKCNL